MSRKKGIFTKTELRSLLTKKNSCVALKSSVIDVYLLPYYLNDVVTGLWNALHRKLKAYDSKLQGILLGYENIKVDLDAGRFSGRNAEIKYPVSCDCYVFQPSVGDKLQGKVNQMSSDHIGCIVHQFFNATIKRPTDEAHEDWNNRCIDYDEVITFRVKDLDYTGFIPYIEGELKTYEAEKSKGRNRNFPDSKYRSDASLISSTQLPSERSDKSSFSDSGLEFDILSPIPQLKNFTKKQKTFRNDDEDEKCIQDFNNTHLKRKHEISPGNKSAKKIKMASDSDAGSSTRDSESNKKKKKKSIFDFLAVDNKGSTKGITDLKIQKLPKISNDNTVLEYKQKPHSILSPYSDAIETVIKKPTSSSYSDTIDSVLKQNKSKEENKHASAIKINKYKLDNRDMIPVLESDEHISLIKKKKKVPVTPISTTSENNSSSVLIVSKKNELTETPKVKKPKQMKITEMNLSNNKNDEENVKKPIQKKIIEFNLATNLKRKGDNETIGNAKETKIRKSNDKLVSKDKKQTLSLSSYSETIENVVKKISSTSYSDTIESVVERDSSVEKYQSPKTIKKQNKKLDIILESVSDEHSSLSEKKMKKSPAKPSQNNSIQKSSGNNETDSNAKQTKIRKLNDKLVSKDKNEKLSLSSYSETIENVVKKTSSTSYSDTIESVLERDSSVEKYQSPKTIKKQKKKLDIILESVSDEHSSLSEKKMKKSPAKQMHAISQNNSAVKSKGSNEKEAKIRKSNNKLFSKDKNETLYLSPYSDAIESVIKKSYIEKDLKHNIEETQSPSVIKKKKKNIDNIELSATPEKSSTTNIHLHISEAIESVIEKINSDSEEHITSNKKKKKSPMKTFPSLTENSSSSIVLTKKKKDKNEVTDSPKNGKSTKMTIEKKNNEIDSSMKQKSIVCFLTADSSKGSKIRKSNVKSEELPLSPYSDAIESVIKQTNSASYMSAIDNVIKQSTYE